jgi:hypothetical protein
MNAAADFVHAPENETQIEFSHSEPKEARRLLNQKATNLTIQPQLLKKIIL